MKTRHTLYSRLIQNFEEKGYVVETGFWTEPVGYKKPTKEYWFDITMSDDGKKRRKLHYWFKNNLNKIDKIELWECDLTTQEDNHTQIC